jgi:hypothetical protein
MLMGVVFGYASHSHAQSVQNWSEPINLSKSGAGSNPSIVVDSHGILHVVWIDKFEGYKYVESPDGVTWPSPVTVKFPFSIRQTRPPVFLADPKGLIHIFWLGDKNELVYAQTLDENLDTPGAWNIRSTLDTAVFDFDVNMDELGRLHVGYVRNPVPPADSVEVLAPVVGKAGAFYRRSDNGGSSWAAAGLLYESAYFRSLTAEKARIRVAASGEKVYAVWDDQAQKRIFMAGSADGGLRWNPVKELIAPQANLSFRTPYHADIDVLQDRLLVTWQVGEPGVQCTPYSSVSSDGGETWAEPIKILAQLSGCPDKSEVLRLDPAYSAVLFTLQDDLSISAWHGAASKWTSVRISCL